MRLAQTNGTPSLRVNPRKIRKAFGNEASDLIATIDIRSRLCAEVLRRGFFGRLRWLLTGK